MGRRNDTMKCLINFKLKKVIELYFDKLDEIVADKRMDNLKSGKSEVVPMEEVFRKAGIDLVPQK